MSVEKTPRMKARTKLLRRLKEIFSRYLSQPTERLLSQINPILRGWLNYFRIGNSSRCFSYIKQWVEKKLRRHLMKSRKRKGFGWKRWSRRELYEMGLYNDYQIRYYSPLKATPAQ
jgi:RNA-directed DNA polymerase